MFVEFKIGLVDEYSPVQTGNVSKEIHHGAVVWAHSTNLFALSLRTKMYRVVTLSQA